MKHCLSGGLLALLFLLTVGCSHREPAVLRQAEALMQPHPDSALALLQTCNRRQLSGRTLARYALLYTMAQNRSLIEVRSDSLLSIAYDYYLRHPSDTLAPRAHLYMGRYYALCDSTKRAEDCLRQCIRLCKTHKDYYTEYLALDCISDCALDGDPQQAVTYAKQAYQVYMEKCSPIIYNEVQLLLQLTACYYLFNETDSALLCAEKSYHLADSAGDSELLSDVFQDFAQIYEVKGDISTSLFYAKKAWENSTHKSSSLIWSLARKYYLADSISEAKTLLTDLLQMQSNSAIKYVAYKTLADIKAKELDNKDIATYTDSACLYIEKMYQEAMSENVEYGKEKERISEEKINVQKRIRTQIIIFSVFLLGLFAFLFVAILINIKIRNRHRIEKEQTKAKAEAFRLKIENKNMQIDMLKKHIMHSVSFQKRLDLQKKSEHKLSLQEADWQEIEDFLNLIDDNFPSLLKRSYPNQKDSDYRFCMLVRLGYSNHDLAEICNISEASIKQKLVDFKTKFNVEDSSLSFRQFISSFNR